MEVWNNIKNYIEAYPLVVVGVWLLICIIVGYIRGFAKQIFPLIAIVISVAVIFGVIRNMATTGFWTMGYSQLAIFVGLIVILVTIGKITGLINKIPVLSHLNRFLGAVLGFVSGAIVALVVYLIF